MSAPADAALANQVRQALRVVIDPELGFNIVDLGLVYDLAVEEGMVRIKMTTTTRGCPAASFLQAGAREGACTVPGVKSVDVALTYDPPWRPRMMSPEIRNQLGVGDGDSW
jgi:metal-sulfur cluster biosynthetic enzyme